MSKDTERKWILEMDWAEVEVVRAMREVGYGQIVVDVENGKPVSMETIKRRVFDAAQGAATEQTNEGTAA